MIKNKEGCNIYVKPPLCSNEMSIFKIFVPSSLRLILFIFYFKEKILLNDLSPGLHCLMS